MEVDAGKMMNIDVYINNVCFVKALFDGVSFDVL